jgi:thymidylate synthase
MLNIHKIVARDLPDLWFQAVNDILDHRRRFKIDKGSYAGQTRLEYDYFIGHVLNPSFGSGTPSILPQIPTSLGIPNPVEFEYVYGGEGYERSYIEYLMTAAKQDNEQYTYGERLIEGDFFKPHKRIDDIFWSRYTINQIASIISTYKKFGYRNNQMVLQIAQPSDLDLEDPPCLRHIDTRIQDNKLHFFIYFRSWDLWGGLPANLAGIETLHSYMASEIGVEQGEFIVESKGLHLYGYAEKLAKIRCMKDCEG